VKNGEHFFLLTEQGNLSPQSSVPKAMKSSAAHTLLDAIFQPNLLDAGKRPVGRAVVLAHPAFADKCVFARNDKALLCASVDRDGQLIASRTQGGMADQIRPSERQ